jgi:hypothetical protein
LRPWIDSRISDLALQEFDMWNVGVGFAVVGGNVP